MKYGNLPLTQSKIKKEMQIMLECIGNLSELANDKIIYAISRLFYELSGRVDRETDVDSLIIDLSAESKQRLDEFELAEPMYYENNVRLDGLDENHIITLVHDSQFLELFTKLEKHKMFFDWLETSNGKVLEQAINEGADFSELMGTIIDSEGLKRLSTLTKI